MNTVGQTCTHVSRQLSDQHKNKEFIRWNRSDLLEYLNEAHLEVGAYRPEAFTAEQTIALVAGSKQKLPNGGVLQSIVRNENGVPPHKADDKLMKAFGAYAVCPPRPRFVNGSVEYEVKTYAIDSDDTHIFYVSPPVPNGLAPNVVVVAQGQATQYTLQDWNKPLAIQPKFYNNIIDYMMARAYQQDTESEVSLAQAQRLFQLFYQQMGAKYKIDSARNSGYYRGEVGTGDPRAQV